MPKHEKSFFFAYGMSTIALLTDFLAKISALKVVAKGDIREAIFAGKNKLFDLLLPPNAELIGERPSDNNKETRYAKFRFSKEEDQKWM